MQNVIVILPKEWNVKRVRYVEMPVQDIYAVSEECFEPAVVITDAEGLLTPLESVSSLYNHPLYPVKKYRKESHD